MGLRTFRLAVEGEWLIRLGEQGSVNIDELHVTVVVVDGQELFIPDHFA